MITVFYEQNKKNQTENLKKTIDNIFLNKIVKKITNELKPRYINIHHITKQGETYESIINNLDISKEEKKLFCAAKSPISFWAMVPTNTRIIIQTIVKTKIRGSFKIRIKINL